MYEIECGNGFVLLVRTSIIFLTRAMNLSPLSSPYLMPTERSERSKNYKRRKPKTDEICCLKRERHTHTARQTEKEIFHKTVCYRPKKNNYTDSKHDSQTHHYLITCTYLTIKKYVKSLTVLLPS